MAVEIMEDGVYFGLPDEVYHSRFALSASGMKHLRASPMNFWAASTMNPDRPEESETETVAKIIGRAYHARILEGRARFYERFAPKLDPDDHAGTLRTVDDLRQHGLDHGLKLKGAKKSDVIDSLLASRPQDRGLVWELRLQEYMALHEGKQLLDTRVIKRIEIAAAMIENHPTDISKAFTGGASEVSVFWHKDVTIASGEVVSIPLKARIDYLKVGAIVDLKSFDNSIGKPLDQAIARAIANYQYHVQAAHYLLAVAAAKELIHDEITFGLPEGFVAAFKGAPEPTFLFVFQQSGIAPVARGKLLPRAALERGAWDVAEAMQVFAENWKHYGDGPWVDRAPISEYDVRDLPQWTWE